MLQSEILSLVERLLPVYGSEDFELVLDKLTDGEDSSAKILVKMELNRQMTPCKKSIDLRSRVQGECREYTLDGIKHYLDDIGFNAYQKQFKKYGGYTEGVWGILTAKRPDTPTVSLNDEAQNKKSLIDPRSPFNAEPLIFGCDLTRQDKRLRMQSQIELTLTKGQIVHGLSVDLSSSGARFKVPSAFKYELNSIIKISFIEFAQESEIEGIDQPLEYRIVAIDKSEENNASVFLRTQMRTNTNIIAELIEESHANADKRLRHDHQHKIVSSRIRSYEHITLKHTNTLPLFFEGTMLKLAMLTPNNQDIWQYWHDERNQQAFGSLFHSKRITSLIQANNEGENHILYSFQHEHEGKIFFYSMLSSEATPEQKQLFWRLGAKRPTWKVFRITLFELTDEEQEDLATFTDVLAKASNALSHVCFMQEICDGFTAKDYLYAENPRIPNNSLDVFRHTRDVIGMPKGIYFETQSRRHEHRYNFKTPLTLKTTELVESDGSTTDLSKHGLGITLETPTALRSGQEVRINFLELQMYDKKLPLNNVPYHVVRISPDGKNVQLSIDKNRQTIKVIGFFNLIIEHNSDKLIQQEQQLPDSHLLERLYSIIFSRTQGVPIFVNKQKGSVVKTSVVGISQPLPAFVELLGSISPQDQYSFEPVFKGRLGPLIMNGIKRIEGIKAQHHDLYVSVSKKGRQITKIEAKLHSEFEELEERIQFIHLAQIAGEFYVIRISTSPIFTVKTAPLIKEISDLAQFGVHHAGKLDNELEELVGYIEINDITEEVLHRLNT